MCENTLLRGRGLSKLVEMFVDGACFGNPGLAGVGVVVYEDGKIAKKLSRFIGEATNNIAEYTAIIYALQEALINRFDEVVICTDSELVYHQMTGAYKVKQPHLKVLYDQACHLCQGIKKLKFTSIPREKNKEADVLAKEAIKKAGQ